MGRYSNTVFQKEAKLDTDNNRRYYDSLIDPVFERSIEDIYVITSIGERLDSLAWKYYGDATLWWVIAAANPELRKDSLYLEPGVQVRVPTRQQTAYNQLRDQNVSR